MTELVKQKDDELYEKRQEAYSHSLNLDFIIAEKQTSEEIETKIEREITKTKKQKMEDFEKFK